MAADNLDPDRIWRTLMTNEKPGGHGERSVAVGHDRHGGVGCRGEDRRQTAVPAAWPSATVFRPIRRSLSTPPAAATYLGNDRKALARGEAQLSRPRLHCGEDEDWGGRIWQKTSEVIEAVLAEVRALRKACRRCQWLAASAQKTNSSDGIDSSYALPNGGSAPALCRKRSASANDAGISADGSPVRRA